MKHAVYINIY